MDPPTEEGEPDHHPEEHDPLLRALARARGVTPSNSKVDDPPLKARLEDGREVRAQPGAGPTHGG